MWLDIVKQDLIDPHDLARDVSEVGHHGTGDVEVKLYSMDELDKVMDLVEQSYRVTT
jgi:predicted transport protein